MKTISIRKQIPTSKSTPKILELQNNRRIAIATQDGFHLINTQDILYLQADSNYCTFHLFDGTKATSSKNLGYYAEKSVLQKFLRVHQSFLINPIAIKRIINGDRNEILLEGGKSVPIARSQKKKISLFISKFL